MDVFLIRPDANQLVFQHSLTHPLFYALNDIQPLSLRSFYATNWMYHEPGSVGAFIDATGKRPIASVVHCVDNTCKLVVTGLRMANGIAASPDLLTVYVAQSTARQINVYSRNPTTNELTLTEAIPTVAMCDNLERDVADANVIYSGCHPKGLQFLFHSLNHAYDAPSQLVKLTRQSDGSHTLETLYYNDGTEFSASSSALVRDGRLYAGCVHCKSVLSCKLE